MEVGKMRKKGRVEREKIKKKFAAEERKRREKEIKKIIQRRKEWMEEGR